MTTTALIVAAGTGERAGGGMPKQFRLLCGKPVLRWAAESVIRHPAVQSTRVVVADGQQANAAKALDGLDVGEFITGGAERADSVRAGLAAIQGDAVLVHDAARPFCPPTVIDRLLAALEFFEGSAPVVPVGDTLARSGETLGEPVDRTGLARVQTPQAFRLDALRSAYADWTGPSPTDEATVVRATGMKVAAVAGDPALEKLTLPSDFERAEQWLAGRMTPRTGMGFDVHAFSGDGPVMLGGIEVPHQRGLAGHSDADVVLHAITDALLGAAGLGDIGGRFPDTDDALRGADSSVLLATVGSEVRARGFTVVNVDTTIIAQAPRMAPHIPAMVANIARLLAIEATQVNIKAKTNERLGFLGRGEGIAALASALIETAGR